MNVYERIFAIYMNTNLPEKHCGIHIAMVTFKL